jgi:hypothetical protein
MKRALDLSTAIKDEDKDSRDEFVLSVRKMHAAMSVGLDLDAVKASVDRLMEMQENSDGDMPSDLANALLTHAIVIYSRATHTTSKHRYLVGVTKAYTKEQKKLHKVIVDLRDNCLAHWGPGLDRWYDERIIYIETDNSAGLTNVHRRTNYDHRIIFVLNELVTLAIPFVKTLQLERAAELGNIMPSISKEMNKLVDASPFDIKAFYGDMPDAEELFWEDKGFTVSHSGA